MDYNTGGSPHPPPPGSPQPSALPGQYPPQAQYSPPGQYPPADQHGGGGNGRGGVSWVWFLLAIVALVGLGVGAFVLFGGDAEDSSTTSASTSTETSTETSTTVEELSGATESIDTTGGEATDTTLASSSASADPSVDGKLFEDPNGMFTITIGNDWVDEPSAEGLSFSSWIVGDQSGFYPPIVSVVTDPSGSRSLDDVLNFTDADLGPNFEILNKSKVKSASGDDMASLEYVSTDDTGLHYLGFAQFGNGVMNIVTLTAPEEVFAAERARIEPFMLTIQGT